MKVIKPLCIFLLSFSSLFSQYTDQINSNRPGISIGAFAVGKRVIQMEGGFAFQNFNHSSYNQSTFNAGVNFLSIRWGFWSERLELTYQGAYLKGTLKFKDYNYTTIQNREGFS